MTKVLSTISAIGAMLMAAIPLVAAAGFAHAEELQPQHIQVADLNLDRPADMARFYARVDDAAGRMCPTSGGMIISSGCRAAVREEATQNLATLRRSTAQAASAQAASAQAATAQALALAAR